MMKFDTEATADRFSQDLLDGKYPVDERAMQRYRYNQMTEKERKEYDKAFAQREQELWEESEPTEEQWKTFFDSDLFEYIKAL